MTAQTILPANTLSGGYDVANSCRFETNTSMTKTASSGNQRTFTISFWVKRTDLATGANQFPISFYQDANNRSEEHTSELQSRLHLVCRLLLEKKKKNIKKKQKQK